MRPDLLLINAKVISMAERPVRADWIAISDGRISGLGRTLELSIDRLRPRKILDCKAKTVLPGFVDAHLHLQAMAKRLLAISLAPDQGIRTIADMQDRIARCARKTPSGRWIRAAGYHEYDLQEKRHPHRKELDRAAPDHPVILTHRTGHAHILNSMGLAMAGINEETGDPDGGLIDRDLGTGIPSGLLYEMGSLLALRLPPVSQEELREGMEQVKRQLLAAGITTVHDVSAGNDAIHYRRMQAWAREGLPAPRAYLAMGYDWFADAEMKPPESEAAGDRLRIAGVKIMLDETTGRLAPNQEQLNQRVGSIHHRGMQAILHAVEEPAIASAVEAIEQALNHHPAADHRHRIEHCAVCPPHLAEKIAALGIQVVSQPGFLHFNGDRYLDTVAGQKKQFLYPFATLIEKGVLPAGSSDAPVAPLAPLQAVHAAVSRTSRAGRLIVPGEAVSLRQALAMMTAYSARAMFAEACAGGLAMGKPADVIILDGDLEDAAPDCIADVQVATTIMNGRVVWQKAGQEL